MLPRPFRMLARTPGGAMTCDDRTDQNVPSPRGVHPIETRASWRVFPRTPAAKAKGPGYATSERQSHQAGPDRAPRASPSELQAAAKRPLVGQNRQLPRSSLSGQVAHGPSGSQASQLAGAESARAVNVSGHDGHALSGRPSLINT